MRAHSKLPPHRHRPPRSAQWCLSRPSAGRERTASSAGGWEARFARSEYASFQPAGRLARVGRHRVTPGSCGGRVGGWWGRGGWRGVRAGGPGAGWSRSRWDETSYAHRTDRRHRGAVVDGHCRDGAGGSQLLAVSGDFAADGGARGGGGHRVRAGRGRREGRCEVPVRRDAAQCADADGRSDRGHAARRGGAAGGRAVSGRALRRLHGVVRHHVRRVQVPAAAGARQSRVLRLQGRREGHRRLGLLLVLQRP